MNERSGFGISTRADWAVSTASRKPFGEADQ